MVKIGLYLMGTKGYSVLSELIKKGYLSSISFIVGAQDKSVVKDYYAEIKNLAVSNEIEFFDRTQEPEDEKADYFFAISWRWLIKNQVERLIVFHDSLLPKYRGFAPLVTALEQGDEQIGVTAIRANAEFDKGNIIGQKSTFITYPIKIQEAIDKISVLYASLMLEVLEAVVTKKITETIQNEGNASYSLWRDEEDYFIDWSQDASKIKRFIDAVGFPYQGAKTNCEGLILRVFDAEVLTDINIVNRVPGKVIYIVDNNPVVVCGRGLLMIKNVFANGTNQQYVFKKMRIRFTNENNI